MRYAASISQLRQLSVVPRGARTGCGPTTGGEVERSGMAGSGSDGSVPDFRPSRPASFAGSKQPGRYKTIVQPSSTVRTADVPAQPWLNGGGVTRELLARPDRDGWQVRVSVADVEADGPFSAFSGVVRWFAVLDGAGVVLTIDGHERRCASGGAALAFAGGAVTRCRLIDGPTRDLNLMLRGVHGALRRVVAGASWRPQARECGLYATAAGSCRSVGRVEPEPMPAHALRWWPAAPDALAFDGAGWWLSAGAEPAP